MSQFQKWAQKEHSLTKRIIALLPAGLFFLIILPYLFLVICPSLDERLGLDRIEPGAATIIIGGILMVVGFFFAFWSISKQLDQGRGTPLPMMPTQELITSGPFRYCRNPMTLGTILGYLGLTIAAATAVGVALVLLFGSLLITYLKKVEDKELTERFGEPYLEYKRNVPFILPRIPRKH
jgi:protein-S-isoprenylcysteine O-methyltransferase Ste14